jgi:hypothetical protein
LRIAEEFNLGLSQAALDFVNVDSSTDARLFVDPRALRLLPTPWGHECVSLIQSFFEQVLACIRAGNRNAGIALLAHLGEPNETHLGLSRAKSRGSGLGRETATLIYDSLAQSEAVKSGLLEDLEETALMVEYIGRDRISDIVTNIIRGPLIHYTQLQADLLGIRLTPQDSGPMWDPVGQWFNKQQDLPRTKAGKLLLVPKAVVRSSPHYDPNDYFNNYVLSFLQEYELAQGSGLVELLKSGKRRVTKKALKTKYGQGKRVSARITLEHNEILTRYRDERGAVPPTPQSQEVIIETTGETPAIIDWSALVDTISAIQTGNAGATAFHKASQALLTAVLYPWLVWPVREKEIHSGRKRIDIVYTNIAKDGFFAWFGQHFPASTVAVECKNYRSDPENPELDQLAGRFSPSRGQLGLLVCRTFKDKDRFLERCRDTAKDHRGYIMPLDDGDLAYMVERRRNADFAALSRLMRERHDYLAG